MIPENDNNDFEIVMGDDTELNISEVGDIVNNLKPNTSAKKKNIIIPVSKKKEQNSEHDNEEKDVENNTDSENN